MYSKKSAMIKIKVQVSYPRKPRKGEGAFLPPCVGRSGTGMSPLRCRFFDDLLGAKIKGHTDKGTGPHR